MDESSASAETGSRSNRPFIFQLNREKPDLSTGSFQPELPGNFPVETEKRLPIPGLTESLAKILAYTKFLFIFMAHELILIFGKIKIGF